MVTASEVGSIAVDLFKEATGQNPDRLKIQKILYYSQGYSLAILKKPLFEDDFIKYDYGPFIPSLIEYKSTIGSFKTYNFPKALHTVTSQETKIIKQVIEMVKDIQSQQTHCEAPWIEAEHAAVITKAKLQTYFTSVSFKFYLQSILDNNYVDITSLTQLRHEMHRSYYSHKNHNMREFEELEAFILENASNIQDYKNLLATLFFPCELDYFGVGEPISLLLSRKSVLLRLAYSSKYNNALATT